jgi:hypothetical protein
MSQESQLNFSIEQILSNVKLEAPLIVGGMRCHGGFDADGTYRSPRTLWRVPAIEAWQSQHRATSPVPLVEIPLDFVPPHMPSVAQAKLLLKNGVREPIVRMLTEISIVEGFGATIRDLPVPPLKSFIRESTASTGLAHLTSGLFEAHARDEAGWGDEGGHKQMWEAARDVAFSNPEVPDDILMVIMSRRSPQNRPQRLLTSLAEPVERLLGFMVGVLAIEVFARSTFLWAEELLADPEISDQPQEASRLVSFIRSDESPHVEYLRTVLSEVAARTLITEDGGELSGREAVDSLLARSLRMMIRQRIDERRNQIRQTVERTAQGKVPDVAEFLAQFDALETPWTPPAFARSESEKPAAGHVGY